MTESHLTTAEGRVGCATMRRRLTGRWAWVTVGMVAAAWFFVSAASFAQTTCLGKVATLVGTEGDDLLPDRPGTT